MIKNRIISIIVCNLLIVGIMPTAVLASDSEVSVNIVFTDGVTEDVTEKPEETSEPTETAPETATEAENEYAETSADTDVSDPYEADGKPSAVIAVCIAAAIVIAAVVIILLIKKRRCANKDTDK